MDFSHGGGVSGLLTKLILSVLGRFSLGQCFFVWNATRAKHPIRFPLFLFSFSKYLRPNKVEPYNIRFLVTPLGSHAFELSHGFLFNGGPFYSLSSSNIFPLLRCLSFLLSIYIAMFRMFNSNRLVRVVTRSFRLCY